MTTGTFRFTSLDSVGAAGAEEDEFLGECFVDTGLLDCLKDVRDRRIILLGRTGAGKSALLRMMAEERPSEIITIAPEELALTYVSNSTVLNFFAGLGVNLDPFYKLLWRHVIVVEILSRNAASAPESQGKTMGEWLKSFFVSESRSDKDMKQSIDYLTEWGENFWQETEYRVKELTQKLETELRSAVEAEFGVKVPPFGGGLSGSSEEGSRITEEQKIELRQRGQEIVSKAQVRDLQNVMKMLENVLVSRGHKYFVLIDRLDENWVEEQTRYKLIMALLDAAKEFIKVGNAKVIVSLRRDLVERVFRLTRGSGFQEEKYDSLVVPLAWTRPELVEVLDRRVDRMVKNRYTKRTVTHIDLLPRNYQKTPITEFITQRATRPRDVIALFNSCIQAAPNLAKLTAKEFKKAEGEYSRGRLRALGDEWSGDYPDLLDFTPPLTKRRQGFELSSITKAEVEELALDVAIRRIGQSTGVLGQAAKAVVDCIESPESLRLLIVKVFYSVGLLGLKTKSFEAISWADERGRGISASEIEPSCRIYIHPMYQRVLGATVKDQSQD